MIYDHFLLAEIAAILLCNTIFLSNLIVRQKEIFKVAAQYKREKLFRNIGVLALLTAHFHPY